MGQTIGEIKHNAAAQRRFLRGCHYGYDLAQRQVAQEVITLELQAREADERLRGLRRAHDPNYNIRMLLSLSACYA